MIAYISADLVGSTTQGWQRGQFAYAIERLLEDLAGRPDVEVVVSQGDSFQIECEAADGWGVALSCYWRMRAVANPGARLAFAVGHGDDRSRTPLALRDGEVYRRAGRGVELNRKRDLRFRLYPDQDKPAEIGWAAASDYADALLRGMTQRQCELLAYAQRPNTHVSGEAIAKHFGLARSTVSQQLKAGHAVLHLRNTESFGRMFGNRVAA